MFAILIYDLSQDQIVIARDRLGIKPLYYAYFNDGIMFASETKSLRRVDSSLSHINDGMVDRFLDDGSVVYKNETFYRNIYSFLPGNYAIIKEFSGKINFCEFWNVLDSTNRKGVLSPDLLRKEVTTAINLHLQSDVPVCTALSGGLDSSIITSVANSFTKSINKDLMTFSVTWPSNPEIDESIWVKEVTDFFDIGNMSTTIVKGEVYDLLNETLKVQDEPFASTTVIAQYALYKKIGSQNYKVVLDGQGADELFLGYQWLFPYFFRDMFYSLNIVLFIRNLFYLIKNRKEIRLGFESLKFIFLTIISPKRLIKKLNHSSDLNSLENLRLNLLIGGNLQSLLKYQDRNSMAWAVESRVPFLDHILVEKVLLTDPRLSFSNGTLKNQLRLAFKDFLPKRTINRKSKFGFSTPEQYWMRSAILQSDMRSNFSLRQWREFIVTKWIEMLNNEI
jgi:asparagine synthase (glutamine-hydrolysing)